MPIYPAEHNAPLLAATIDRDGKQTIIGS